MIVRIVKMTFRPEELTAFQELFNRKKEFIRSFEGCRHLELWQDTVESAVFFTYSHWESEDALNNYRCSVLFKEVWADTKTLFAAKPAAWSVTQKVVV